MNVIPLRSKLAVFASGAVEIECSELVHMFEAIPGRCQCGERIWDDSSGGGEKRMGATGEAQDLANKVVDSAQELANGAVDLGEEAAALVLDAVVKTNRLLGDVLESVKASLVK